MKRILALFLIASSLHAQDVENVWSWFTRPEYEATENTILNAQVEIIQKRDWGDDADTNNVKHQYNFSFTKDGQEGALFCYAVNKTGEVLDADWADYQTACGVGLHAKGFYGLTYIKALWGLEETTNSWRDVSLVPFVQDNTASDKKGKGFEIAYAIAQPFYSDKDTSSILNNILNMPDNETNRAFVDAEFDKETYVLSQNTNIPIYVWSAYWDKQATTSRKDCKKAESQGSANASCGILRSTDKDKVMNHYQIKEKKK